MFYQEVTAIAIIFALLSTYSMFKEHIAKANGSLKTQSGSVQFSFYVLVCVVAGALWPLSTILTFIELVKWLFKR